MEGTTYRLRIPEPHTHLVHVELTAHDVRGPARLVMPSWTPGSYLMREFPRNVVALAAEDGAGRPLAAEKTDKNAWRVEAPADGTLRARYTVYANELSVRTSHVDASHASINGASVFVYLEGREGAPHRVEVEAPAGWRATTALPEDGSPLAFRAESYDALVDAPIEIGTHELIEWEIDGKRHRWAIWGRGNHDPRRLVADTTRIVRAERALFGELPYASYTFILHLTPGGSGGLEHRESTVLLADRWSFRGVPYENFLGLVAHEFFHLWNGKRIRPAVLGPFDYTREAYTRELWVVEGITTYYTDLFLRRAGLIPPQRYLDKVAEQVTRLQGLPGRTVQPLEDASFDAWIKFYRPDANSSNATISYYHKGGLVALLLDLRIRRATGNARSLDDVMRALWDGWGARDVGFPPGTVERVAAEVAGEELSGFFDRALRGTEELDYAAELAAAGLKLVPAHEGRPGAPPVGAGVMGPGGDPSAPPRGEVSFGVQFKHEGGKTVVGSVLAGSPAWRAGVNAGDELVALDGLRVGPESLSARLMEKTPGERARLAVFRRDELLTLEVEVETRPPARLALREVEDATEEARRLREDWLRTDVPPEGAGAGGGG
ncbi:MAG TPA: PDZ domain-containing protein [Longimicrobium sp.]|nr:PDZ domain-containing protein [Longimicrobium sp.]